MSTRRYFLHRRATCWNKDIKGGALTRRANGTDPIEIWKKLKFWSGLPHRPAPHWVKPADSSCECTETLFHFFESWKFLEIFCLLNYGMQQQVKPGFSFSLSQDFPLCKTHLCIGSPSASAVICDFCCTGLPTDSGHVCMDFSRFEVLKNLLVFLGGRTGNFGEEK